MKLNITHVWGKGLWHKNLRGNQYTSLTRAPSESLRSRWDRTFGSSVTDKLKKNDYQDEWHKFMTCNVIKPKPIEAFSKFMTCIHHVLNQSEYPSIWRISKMGMPPLLNNQIDTGLKLLNWQGDGFYFSRTLWVCWRCVCCWLKKKGERKEKIR